MNKDILDRLREEPDVSESKEEIQENVQTTQDITQEMVDKMSFEEYVAYQDDDQTDTKDEFLEA